MFDGYLACSPRRGERWEGQARFREKRETLGLQSKCLILLVIDLVESSSFAGALQPNPGARPLVLRRVISEFRSFKKIEVAVTRFQEAQTNRSLSAESSARMNSLLLTHSPAVPTLQTAKNSRRKDCQYSQRRKRLV